MCIIENYGDMDTKRNEVCAIIVLSVNFPFFSDHINLEIKKRFILLS